MIISYPESPSRIIVLLKTLRHIIQNLKEKSERKERTFTENRKRGIIFPSNAINKRARKPLVPLDVLQRFRSKFNEFNETSQGERKGFTFEKPGEFVDSELL